MSASGLVGGTRRLKGYVATEASVAPASSRSPESDRGTERRLVDVFGKRLADHLPDRVLPISTKPLTDPQILVGEQYQQVRDLLKPGKRRRAEARSLLRGLLAMEGHVSAEARVSERDVDRVERAVREGRDVHDVFPRLGDVSATFDGEGPLLQVHFTKREGAPVHFVPADDPAESAAVREVDLQRKYHLAPAQLAEKVGLTGPKQSPYGVRWKSTTIQTVVTNSFLGSQRLPRYSDNAFRRMTEALENVDTDDVWAQHGPKRR